MQLMYQLIFSAELGNPALIEFTLVKEVVLLFQGKD